MAEEASEPSAPPRAHRLVALPWLIVLLGGIATLALWTLLDSEERRVVEARFRADARERALRIQHELRDATAALEDFSAFYAASEEVLRDEFRRFAVPMLARRPSLRAVGWNPRVLESQRQAHEAEMRAAGLTGYEITERAESGGMVRAAEREEHVAVAFIEPYPGNEEALGFDVASEPRRLRALQRARDTGEISATEGIILVQEEEPHYGVLAFAPRYRHAEPAMSVAQRRASLEGFLVGVFRIRDIFEAALEPFDADEIDIALIDELAPASDRLLHRHVAGASAHGAGLGEVPLSSSGLYQSTALEWAGRQWRLVFIPTPAFLASHRTRVPVGVLVGGLLVTVLLVASARAMTRHNESLRSEMRQREQAERALRESEERLRLTLDAIADGGWDWDIATGEVFFSDSWLASLGYERGDVAPHVEFWEEMLHPEDRERVQKALTQHLEGQTRVYECENRLRMKSGEYRWNLDRGGVVSRDAAGRPLRMVGTDTDITARRQSEEEKRRLEEIAREAQKLESLGLLAGGIAHDFNNILVGILTSADFALAEMSPEPELRTEIEQIKLSASRAADLTREMLAYSGRGRFVIEIVDLSRSVDEMNQLLEASISKKARVAHEKGRAAPVVEGDSTQLRQVLMNLLTNASDALGEQGGDITIRTGVKQTEETVAGAVPGRDLPPGAYAYVEVSDTGCGMDEETVRRIFDPFFTTKFNGRGLGLASVLGIVRGHGGTLEVQSSPGQGSTFTVLLPHVEDEEPAGAPAEKIRGELWIGEGTVLVADDEPTVRRLVSRILESAGLTVLTACDGQQALEIFREHAEHITAVLLDVTMPRMSGEEALLAIRELRSEVPVILASGYTEDESSELFASRGVVGFLKKPFGVSDLLALMRTAMKA